MSSMRKTALALGLVALMTGCGTTPTAATLRGSATRVVDAQSKEGLKAALKLYLTVLFRRLDANGDGKLTQAEAGSFFTKDQFANLNTNNNAFISLNEVLDNKAFISAAVAKLHDYAATTLAGIDQNQDGKLSWNEYLSSINANASMTTSEKTYAQLAFNLADRNHDGVLVLDEYEDMVSMAMVNTATTPMTLIDAFQKSQQQVAGKYGTGLVPMGVSIRWINRFGNFTKDEGCYAFTYWEPIAGKAGAYDEILAKVYQSKDPASARDVSANHEADATPAGIDYTKLLTPTQAIDDAAKLGVPTVGDHTAYFVQYIAASGGMPDRIYVDSYQSTSAGDNRLGGVTLDAATGAQLGTVTKGPLLR